MLHTHAVKKREKSRASETTNLFISCERMRGIQKQNTPSPNLNFPFFVSLSISLLSSLPIPLPFLDPYSLHFITIFTDRGETRTTAGVILLFASSSFACIPSSLFLHCFIKRFFHSHLLYSAVYPFTITGKVKLDKTFNTNKT